MEGAVSQVWVLGALRAAAAPAPSVLTSLDAALLPPPHSLQGTAARPPRALGPVPTAAPKVGGVLGGLLEETGSDNRAVAWGWVCG